MCARVPEDGGVRGLELVGGDRARAAPHHHREEGVELEARALVEHERDHGRGGPRRGGAHAHLVWGLGMMSLEYEPASEPLHISGRGVRRTVPLADMAVSENARYCLSSSAAARQEPSARQESVCASPPGT